MKNAQIMIAVVVVLVIAVAAYYFMLADPETPATPPSTSSTPSTSSSSTPTGYIIDATNTAAGGTYWDNAAKDAYSCPTGYTTKTPGYCVLPVADAAAACKTDAKCLGYLLGKSTDTIAQLTTGVAPNGNKGQIYYRKI